MIIINKVLVEDIVYDYLGKDKNTIKMNNINLFSRIVIKYLSDSITIEKFIEYDIAGFKEFILCKDYYNDLTEIIKFIKKRIVSIIAE